jgi:16S rRNA G527 N7-methylase RsmG
VKHREANPETIGRDTRALVEAWLLDHRVDVVDARFGERIEKLASAVALWGVRMNLTAAPSDPAELAFHVLDSLGPLVVGSQPTTQLWSAALTKAFGEGSRVLDLGAGAGFPGLVLAAATNAKFVLAEARRKRASFLAVTAGEMGLRNARVEGGQMAPATIASGDAMTKEGGFDTVVARAFAQPTEFHQMAAAALRPRGLAILYANPGQELALGSARSFGMGEVREFGYPISRDNRTVNRILAVWRMSEGDTSD